MTEQYRFDMNNETVKMYYTLIVGQIELSNIDKNEFDHTIWKHGMEWSIGECYSYEITCVQNESLPSSDGCTLWIGTIYDNEDHYIAQQYAGEDLEVVYNKMIKHFLTEIERWIEDGHGIDNDELTDTDEESEENRRRLDADDARNDVMYPDTDVYDAFINTYG